jgi:hypothetical protein
MCAQGVLRVIFRQHAVSSAGLDSGEDVDAPVAEFEAVVAVVGLEAGGSGDGEAHADGGDRAPVTSPAAMPS